MVPSTTSNKSGPMGPGGLTLAAGLGLAAVLALAGSAISSGDWNDVSVSDSVVSFGTVATGVADSAVITVTNNLLVPIYVTAADFEEDVFSASVVDQATPIPSLGNREVRIYFETDQNVTYSDFLRIQVDHGMRPLIVEVSATGDYPGTYYDGTQDKWAEELKTSLTDLIDGHTSLGYTLARDEMYGSVDNDDTCAECPTTGCVECIYTGRIGCFNTRAGATANNFNCEHTWPQSFFSENEPMRSDLFQIRPSDATANTKRASLDFGVVVSTTWTQGGSKLGTDSTGQTVFEPRDAKKGDIARNHFYFIIRYSGNYVGYADPAKMEVHFRDWHAADPPDAGEMQRNEDVYALQNNRNPFIDHPAFADRISSFFGTAVRNLEPEIAVSPPAADMGPTEYDTTAYYHIAVMNTGTDTLNVSSIVSSNPDFMLDKAGLTLPPDTYEYVTVSYASAHADTVDSALVSIVSDDPDEGLVVQVPVTVTVGQFAGVAGGDAEGRHALTLHNYPNPFGRETTIRFYLDRQASAGLNVYNVEGKLVSTVMDQAVLTSGSHQVVFDGSGLTPGVYFCRLTTGDRTLTRRMLRVSGSASR